MYCYKCSTPVKSYCLKLNEQRMIGLFLKTKWSICGTKKSRLSQKPKSNGFLSSFGIKRPL